MQGEPWYLVGTLGEWHSASIADPALRWNVACYRDTAAAVAALETSDSPPPLVILCEPRPGSLSQAEVDRLRAAAPLTRIVRLQGSWCEGQARSGPHLHGCLRVGWQAAHWQLERWQRDQLGGSLLHQPLTLTPEETWLAESRQFSTSGVAESQHAPTATAGGVAIRSDSASSRAALTQLCRQAGFVLLANSEFEQAALLLWDTRPEVLHDRAAIARVRGKNPRQILALCGFPRAEDLRAASDAGIAAVIAKPFHLAHLVERMRSLLDPSS